jgi:hypothetical protein
MVTAVCEEGGMRTRRLAVTVTIIGTSVLSFTASIGAALAQGVVAEDTRILLETGAFDPLRGPQRVPPELRLSPEAATDRWIVQFRAPLTREQRDRLSKEFGLKLDRYIPNLAYLERIAKPDLDRLRKDSLVRAAVAYQPAFKISPRIGKARGAFRTPERRAIQGLLLRAVLFDDANAEEILSALQRLPGVSAAVLGDFRPVKGEARIEFTLASQSTLPAIAKLPGVRWIEEVGERIEDNGATAGTIQSGTQGTVPIWNRGLHGEGQIVAVVEGGGALDANHCMFRDPVNNTPSALHRKLLQVGGAATGHATFVAGIVAGDDFNNPGTGANRGNAWAARLISVGAGALPATLNNNAALGARIHTNSWHDDTNDPSTPGGAALYDQVSADVDTFIWNNQDNLVFGSMGNNGEEQGPPGTAKNAVGVNASLRDPNEGTVGDGNPGPTADGRRKPDVVTPGCAITSAIVGTACGVQTWPGAPNVCATSWATPAAAATTALIRQYYTEGWYPSGTARPVSAMTPTGALLKATLLNATVDMAGQAGYPNVTEGWGMVRLNNTLFFPGSPRRLRAWDVRNADGVATGEFQAFTIEVAASTEPLKVTLAWSDAPGTSGAANPVVNNLDLTVIAPYSTTFRGNVFAGGQSTPGGVADALNNVEQVVVNAPAVGMWTMRVGGTVVNVGAPGQGFAVVATARVSAPAIQAPGSVSLAAPAWAALLSRISTSATPDQPIWLSAGSPPRTRSSQYSHRLPGSRSRSRQALVSPSRWRSTPRPKARKRRRSAYRATIPRRRWWP